MANEADMPLLEHLSELRKRLLWCILAVFVFAVFGFSFAEPLMQFLLKPFYAVFPESSLIGTGPAEAFILKIKLALFAGIIAALPVLLFHFWRFVSPGLLESEKKLLVPFVVSATALFLAGAYFCYSVIFPIAFNFFLGEYQSLSINPQIRISELLSFVIVVVLAFGSVFEIPVITFLLARAGIVSDKILMRYFRVAIVAAFIIGAVLTPPDIITQCLLAVPLLLLYGVSIFVAKVAYRERF